jgi:arsenate reductase
MVSRGWLADLAGICYDTDTEKGGMTMLFIQYPPCTTCQKAKKWLDGKEISYTDRHIKEQNPTYEELKAWYERSGLPLKRFFNTSGLLYKSLNLKDKLPTMTDEEQLQLLSSDGMLVKRPLLVMETAVLVGFKEKEWEDKLP